MNDKTITWQTTPGNGRYPINYKISQVTDRDGNQWTRNYGPDTWSRPNTTVGITWPELISKRGPVTAADPVDAKRYQAEHARRDAIGHDHGTMRYETDPKDRRATEIVDADGDTWELDIESETHGWTNRDNDVNGGWNWEGVVKHWGPVRVAKDDIVDRYRQQHPEFSWWDTGDAHPEHDTAVIDFEGDLWTLGDDGTWHHTNTHGAVTDQCYWSTLVAQYGPVRSQLMMVRATDPALIDLAGGDTEVESLAEDLEDARTDAGSDDSEEPQAFPPIPLRWRRVEELEAELDATERELERAQNRDTAGDMLASARQQSRDCDTKAQFLMVAIVAGVSLSADRLAPVTDVSSGLAWVSVCAAVVGLFTVLTVAVPRTPKQVHTTGEDVAESVIERTLADQFDEIADVNKALVSKWWGLKVSFGSVALAVALAVVSAVVGMW